jgi:putative ABC transport system substrate-binding protein
MKRRELLVGLGGALAAPQIAQAQQARKMPVVGVIWHTANEQSAAPWFGYLRQAFADVGYVPGKNIVFEDRYPSEIPERFDIVANELVQLKVNLICTNILQSFLAAQKATSTIPILFIVSDPIRQGVVKDLSRPGENVTGASYMLFELNPKRAQLFREMVPTLSRVAHFVHADSELLAGMDIETFGQGAKELDFDVEIFKARNVDELRSAFSRISRPRFDGIYIGSYPGYGVNLKSDIAEYAIRARLPTMGFAEQMTRYGCLASYEASHADLYRIQARLAKRVLNGEKPGDLPVEQPTKFTFVLNLKTAKAIGLEISPQIMARVDQVIE